MKSDSSISGLLSEPSNSFSEAVGQKPDTLTITVDNGKSKVQEILLNRTAQNFRENPIFQDTNPNAKKNKEIYINTLAAKGYDKKQLQNLSEGIDENTKFMQTFDNPYGALQPIVDFSADLVVGAAHGVNEGLEKFNKGVGTVIGALGGQTGGFTDKAEELSKGGLEVVTGLGETALSGASVAVPEMAAFVAGSEAIKQGANANLPEYEAKYVNDIVDFPFAATSKIAQALGFNPAKHENWNMVLQVLDFAAIAKGAQVYGKSKNPIQSVKDLNDMSAKAVKGELSPEDLAKYQEMADQTKGITIEEILPVAKEKGATEIVDKINDANAPQPELKTSTKLDELNKAVVNDVTAPIIEAAKQEEIQRLADESRVEGEAAVAENAKQEAASHVQETLDANKGNVEVEALLKPLAEYLPKVEPVVELVPEEVKVVEDYDGGSYSKGKTSEDIAKEQGVEFSSPEEADRHISEESQNPLEIATRYLQLDIESAKDTKAYTDQLLDASGIKLTREEFSKIADKNIINENISKKFLNENPEIHFDKKLEEINEVNGTNISHEDLVDYIRRADAENYVPQESGIRTKFRNRFKELTGQELTPSKAKMIIESEVKKLNKEYEKFIGKEYGSYAEAEQGYYDAIKSGEIAIEGGEVVSIPGRGKAAQERLAELDKLVDAPERVKAISSEKKKLEKELDKSDGKKLKLGERILDSDNVSDGIKIGLMKKGIEYIPIDMEVTLNDAKAYVKEFVDAGELDQAIVNVTNTSNKMSGVNRGVIGKELFEVLADKVKNSETISDQKKWQGKAVEIATFAADNFRKAGQEINAAKVWKRMLERTPEGAIASIKQSYLDNNKVALDANKTSIKDAKSFLDDFLKSKDFESIVGEKVKAELAKLNKSPQKGNIFNSKSVRDSRKSELKAKWEQAKKSTLSSSIIGLNKEQIEIAGEMALLHIIDGVVKVSELAVKLKKDFDTITPEQVNKLWEEHKIADKTIAEYAKEKAVEKFEERTINDALKIFSGEIQDKIELKAFRESVKELNKKEFLDTWNKKLKNLKPENRRNLLGKVIAEIESLGGLSDERFREMYAEEMGLKTLTPEAERHVRKLIDTINKSEKSGSELQKLFDNDTPKSEIEAKKKEWISDVFEGNKANGELSQYFKHDKKLGNTVATLLQGNLLGPLSLVKNVYSNTLIQPLRSASRGISSVADYAMSKAATLPVLNKMINEGRTIDALAYWKGASKGIRPGLNTAVKELIRGINPEEMIERDKNQSLEPLKSMSRFYEGLTGKEKQTVYQQLNNFTEGVFGLPAEGMFRLLNLGDKPFRKSAEFGAAYEIGTLKGLKGKELEKFVLFPDEVSAKEIKKQAEKAVYQQSEGATKAIQNGLRVVEDFLSDTPVLGDVWKVGFKSIIPYVKTPLNIIGETIKFALPEYSIAKGIYESVNGNRSASLKSFGDAVVGLSIRQGVSALMSNNLVTGSGDYRDKEATAIQQQNVPPSSINISGLQRMMSGGSAAPKDNDTWVNYTNMGVVGIMLGIHSNQVGIKDSDKSYLSEMSTMLPTVAQISLEQSFLQGTNSFLEAVGDKDGRVRRKWAINSLGTLGSIAWPNTLANISKASDNTARNVKDESFTQELVNNFKVKMFQGDKLPSKVNLWGEKVHGAPEGRNKYLWYLLDVTKFKDVPTDSYNYKIFDLWKNAETPEEKRYILPNIPVESLTIKKDKVKLSTDQYEKYQMYVGKNRADLVRKYAESPNWEKDTREIKIKKLKDLYSDGLSNGKRQLFKEYPELKKRKK